MTADLVGTEKEIQPGSNLDPSGALIFLRGSA